jgi:RNA polymerase sigma factor (sigma-70 family)
VTTDSEHRQDLDRAQRAFAGDERAWRAIYDDTCQNLFNLLAFQVGDRDAAMDLLQETYLTALGKLDRYRGQGPLGAWLRRIALRKALDWRRSLARRLRGDQRLARETDEAAPAVAAPHFAGERAAFQAALNRLSARQRAALILREVEGLDFAEIAAALGCREATARVHLHRAREGMRRLLSGSETLVFAEELEGWQP